MGEIVFMAMHSWGLGEQDEFPATPHGASWRQRMLVSSWGTPFSLGTAQWVKRLRSRKDGETNAAAAELDAPKNLWLGAFKAWFSKIKSQKWPVFDVPMEFPLRDLWSPSLWSQPRFTFRWSGTWCGCWTPARSWPTLHGRSWRVGSRAPSQAGWMAWMGGSWAEKDTPLVSTGRVPDSQWPTLEKNHPN